MSSFRAVAPEQIASLAGKLAGLRWSWSIAELERVLPDLGWTPVGELDEHGATVAVGRDSADGHADVRIRHGVVVQLRLLLTGGTDDPATETAARQDVFSTVASVVTEVVGPAWDRLPGERPEVRWKVPSGILQTIDNGVFVEFSLLSEERAASLERSTADVLDNVYDEDDGFL